MKLERQNEELRTALKRMLKLHDLMMRQANHAMSFYDTECLMEMNKAPFQAREALKFAEPDEKDKQ